MNRLCQIEYKGAQILGILMMKRCMMCLIAYTQGQRNVGDALTDIEKPVEFTGTVLKCQLFAGVLIGSTVLGGDLTSASTVVTTNMFSQFQDIWGNC
eukprot:1881543-Ditylum_brightwellii.AAC.1